MSAVSPHKLKSSRLRNNWTLRELSELLTQKGHKISSAALSQFEKGDTSPKASTLRALAAAFKLRPSELMESDFKLDFIGFRSLSSLSKSKKTVIKARMSEHAEKREKLCSYSGIQRKPWSLTKSKISVVEQADEIALQIRNQWNLGIDAIQNLSDAIESNGGEVIELQDDERYSGLSAIGNNGIPYLAIQQRENDGARQRMDLAHELAHLVFDTSSPVDEEDFAKRFAGVFLLPRDVVISELGSNRRDLSFSELKSLKKKYGVSIQGWIRRAKDCAIISDATYTRLQKRLSSLGYRKDEGQPYISPELIDRDTRLAARCVTERTLSIEDASTLAGISPAILDDSYMTNDKTISKAPKLGLLSREERRALAKKGAALTALAYQESPEDLVSDLAELIED